MIINLPTIQIKSLKFDFKHFNRSDFGCYSTYTKEVNGKEEVSSLVHIERLRLVRELGKCVVVGGNTNLPHSHTHVVAISPIQYTMHSSSNPKLKRKKKKTLYSSFHTYIWSFSILNNFLKIRLISFFS